MAVLRLLLITYDLKHPASDYVILFNHLKSTGTWWHNIPSTWMIVTDKTEDDWANLIRCCVHPDDRFFVVEVSDRHFNGWLTQEGWNWIYNCGRQIQSNNAALSVPRLKNACETTST